MKLLMHPCSLPGPKVRKNECLGPGDMWKVGDMFYIQCCMNIDASHVETVNIFYFLDHSRQS